MEKGSFDSFKNLSHLKLKYKFIENFPELLFAKLVHLKELDITGNLFQKTTVNKSHFKGLEHLQTLKLNVKELELDDDLDFMAHLKELELTSVILNKLSFQGLERLEKLKLSNFKFSLKTKCQRNFFTNLKHLKYLEILCFEQVLAPKSR